ncbi:MAG: histidine phosphatase family protein [Firmicutes bacterium]|nr:histidine phosphatase family protein [Bacillota bacterium]
MSKMKKRMIYLLRHAETLLERSEKIFLGGRSNPPLSPAGIRQAKALASALSGRELEAIYCSDLRRSRQTAAIIAQKHGLKPRVCTALREIGLGEWEGLAFTEVQNRYPREFRERGEKIVTYRPPGGESFADLAQRVLPAFQRIVAETRGNIAIVGHAGVNRVIICHVQQLDLKQLFGIRQEYGHVTVIEQNNNLFRIDKEGL